MAQTQIYTRRAQVGVTVEVTQGTYVVPTAGSCFLAEIPDDPLTFNSQQGEANYVREDFLSIDDPPPGAISASISFSVPIRGGGKPASDVLAPDYGVALQACGLAESDDSPTPITYIQYSPSSTYDGAGGNPGQSYSISIIEDGKVAWGLAGAFGNVTLDAEVGSQGRLNFNFTGAYVIPVADAFLTPTYDTTIAPVFQGASMTVAATAEVGLSNLSYDFGAQVVTMPDVTKTHGILGAAITGRRGTGSFEAQVKNTLTFGTNDPWALWVAGTTAAIATGVVGSTAGNRWQLKINRASRRTPSLASADGIRKYSQEFKAGSAATDVEGTNFDVELEFT